MRERAFGGTEQIRGKIVLDKKTNKHKQDARKMLQ
jgi:hypothetical protein